MICDMCGSHDEMFRAEVEGAILNLCGKCSKFGKVLGQVRIAPVERTRKPEPEIAQIITDDYPAKIRAARERLGLTQKEFASRLNEKESLIHQLESGSMEPSILLARKLERFLRVRLVEEYQESHSAQKGAGEQGFTLGDFIRKK